MAGNEDSSRSTEEVNGKNPREKLFELLGEEDPLKDICKDPEIQKRLEKSEFEVFDKKIPIDRRKQRLQKNSYFSLDVSL